MSVPDYQTLLLPLLRLAGSRRAQTLAQAEALLADEFALSDADRQARLPSGQQTALRNRVGWASFYLKNAGLLEKPKRGQFFITPRGEQVLAEAPAHIDLAFLSKFPEFRAFYMKGSQGDAPQAPALETIKDDRTPDEVLEAAHASITDELASELLSRLLAGSPEFFERVVVELLVAMGYGGSLEDAGQRIGKSGDGGIDGIIKEDRLGLDAIYIQAKRWQGSVGRPEIQKFVGALQGQRARKGVFMTTSSFSAEAVDYVSRIDARVVLLDGRQITRLMIDHGVGVTPVATYVIKRIDSDYFEEA
jgi:restriction system protein